MPMLKGFRKSKLRPWRFLKRAQRDFPVQSDGGPQSAGQTENSFRQSQTILQDLKRYSLPKRHYSFCLMIKMCSLASTTALRGIEQRYIDWLYPVKKRFASPLFSCRVMSTRDSPWWYRDGTSLDRILGRLCQLRPCTIARPSINALAT